LKYDGGQISSRIKEDGSNDPIGQRIKGSIEKSRLGSPWGTFLLYFYTEVGAKHPVYKTPTVFGFDIAESLFDYYLNSRFTIADDGAKVVASPSKGWYLLHKSIDDKQKKFRSRDWPEKLASYPELKRLLYDALELDVQALAPGLPFLDG
jgi:hypothetical protein